METDVDDTLDRTWTMTQVVGDIPTLLGYTPHDELLAIPVDGNDSCALAVSIVQAQAMSPADYAAAGQQLYAATGGAERSTLVLLAVTRDAARGRQLLDRARMFLEHPIGGRILIDGDQWHDVDRNTTGPVHHWPVTDRVASPPRVVEQTPLTAELDRTRDSWAERVLASRDAYAAEREWISETIHHAVTAGDRLTDRDAARLLLDVGYTELRDVAIIGVGAANARGHADLWADLADRAPHQDLTPPATLAGLCLFLDSRPERARDMLDLAPDGDTYTLARLVDHALRIDADPRAFAPTPDFPLNWPPTGRMHHNLPPQPASPRPAPPAPSTPGIDAPGAGSPAR